MATAFPLPFLKGNIMIYVDPTELRDNTKLPAALVGEAKNLPGLEAMTGADILVTPHDDFILTELKDILPHRKSLQYHCDDGILIQRKSGGDFLSSIDDLVEIEWRMQEWSDNPWLLVTEIKRGKNGRVVAGGRYFKKWNYASISGALDAWQDRGGSVKKLANDQDIYQWVKNRERRCMTWLQEPEKKVSKGGGKKGKVSRQSLRRIQDTWCSTKWAFPAGIGRVMMESLARYIVEKWERPPTFANAIALACSDEVLKVNGWGKVSLNNVREWYGVTNSVSPVSTGAESGCWIYNLPARPTGRKVFVVGDKIIDGDTVFEVVTEPLGEIGGDIIDLTGRHIVKDDKWK